MISYKIIWSNFAEQQIDEIYDYYKNRTKSKIIALKIVSKILLAPNSLIKNPRIGGVEILLNNFETEYFYIYKSNYKIIYSIDEENKLVKIADVFDVRQNPEKIKRKK